MIDLKNVFEATMKFRPRAEPHAGRTIRTANMGQCKAWILGDMAERLQTDISGFSGGTNQHAGGG